MWGSVGGGCPLRRSQAARRRPRLANPQFFIAVYLKALSAGFLQSGVQESAPLLANRLVLAIEAALIARELVTLVLSRRADRRGLCNAHGR
jgi:hypothetical protein